MAIWRGRFLLFLPLFVNLSCENKPILLATTTSVQNTGLLDVLLGGFMKNGGMKVKTIAVGTGHALELGKNGEVDILLVHSEKDEIDFVKNGYGTKRATFMHNDFVILGPKDDPAEIKGIKGVDEAFKKIAKTKVFFVSRADNSGTYKKERELWEKARVVPNKRYYIEVGQGMAACLNIANQKLAYCLADRSTYLSLKKNLDLVVLFEGDKALFNPYSLILVNPKMAKRVNEEGAKKLFDYLLSDKARDIIKNFGKDKYGMPLFYWDYLNPS